MNKKLKLEELNRLSVLEFKEAEKDPIIVLLDDVRSLNNIGSVFRTCDAMGVKKMYLCGITGQPPHREIRKTAIGASESVDWEHKKNAPEILTKLSSNSATSGPIIYLPCFNTFFIFLFKVTFIFFLLTS